MVLLTASLPLDASSIVVIFKLVPQPEMTGKLTTDEHR